MVATTAILVPLLLDSNKEESFPNAVLRAFVTPLDEYRLSVTNERITSSNCVVTPEKNGIRNKALLRKAIVDKCRNCFRQ